MRIDRRTFIGLLSGAALGAGYLLWRRPEPPREPDLGPVPEVVPPPPDPSIRILPSTCDHDCGGRCLMQVHVKDGRVVHITTDDGTMVGRPYGAHDAERWQLRTCTRGRAYREHLYAPDRLLTPMKRVGARGEGKFAPISWDEALDTVASRLKAQVRAHGHASIFAGAGSGTASALNATFDLQMLLAQMGGFTSGWSAPSWEGAHFAMEFTTGANDRHGPSKHADGFDAADILRTKLLLLWGWNPAHTHFGTSTKYYLMRAREQGIPFVCVDPVYTDTAGAWGTEWIPIKPGSDAAVLCAMAHVILDEGLADRPFVERFTHGMADYHAHLRGQDDGVVKDPRWASAISGIPAQTIVSLARRYATTKPAKLVAGYAPGRSAFGEQYHRAAIALQALTGNIGRPGGSAAGHLQGKPIRSSTVVQAWWERFSRDIDVHDADIAMIKTTHFADAVLGGKSVSPAAVGSHKPLPSDIRALYAVGWNAVNQLPNINKTVRALQKLDFVVVQEQRMTPTARWADVLLPACTMLEREDFTYPWRDNEPFIIAQAKAVEPLGESKADHWIFDQLAKRLGLTALRPDGPPRKWLDKLLAMDEHAPFADLLRHGELRERRAEPWIAFRENVEGDNPIPFQTPSGRIEIRSTELAGLDFAKTSYGREIPSLPTHLENEEGPSAQGTLPLQLITTKVQNRCHSTFTGNPLLEELGVQSVWIHTTDAAARRVAEGDAVEVFNARGRIRLRARVTERITPGVVMIHEGAWYDPDPRGIDRGGNPNVLTNDLSSPGGAYPYNTSRVEIVRVA